MTRLALTLLALVFAGAAHAESLVTIRPEPKNDVWWQRAEFHALDTEIRDIPVKSIDPRWCKASEFKSEKFPPNTLIEDGYDYFKETGLSFSVEGSFDGSGTKQTALVGVCETCANKKGRFLLIFDSLTRKVRFLDTDSDKHQFSAIGADGHTIHVAYCFECDISSTVRWDRARKRFVMR